LEYIDFEVVLVKYGLIVFYSYQHGLMAEKILKKNNIPCKGLTLLIKGYTK
jgi:hypothetical protein